MDIFDTSDLAFMLLSAARKLYEKSYGDSIGGIIKIEATTENDLKISVEIEINELHKEPDQE